jgi:hypothetical protein
MTNYGMAVSEPGFDVKTADDKNLSLKTGFTLLKVYSQGSMAVNGTQFTNTVSHNLGYIPQYLSYVKSSNTAYLAKGYFGAIDLPVAIAKVGTANLSLYNTGGTSLTAFNYIFYEPVDTGTAPSIVSTNNYGIKISKDGVDIGTANILQQTFNSEKNSLKIISDGTTATTANGARDITVAHGMNFIPGFLTFYEVDNSGTWLFDATREDLSGKGVSIDAQSDGTNLTMSVFSSGTATVKLHYYILADPGVSV